MHDLIQGLLDGRTVRRGGHPHRRAVAQSRHEVLPKTLSRLRPYKLVVLALFQAVSRPFRLRFESDHLLKALIEHAKSYARRDVCRAERLHVEPLRAIGDRHGQEAREPTEGGDHDHDVDGTVPAPNSVDFIRFPSISERNEPVSRCLDWNRACESGHRASKRSFRCRILGFTQALAAVRSCRMARTTKEA